MDPVRPIDVAIRETHDFVRRYLPSPPADLVEPGGGRGEFAERLLADGYRIVIVDPSAAAAAEARARGVEVREQSWIEFDPRAKRYAAVLFVRSLHHLSPLDEAARVARACLRPDGRVLVEDFAFQSAEPALIDWCASTARRLRDTGRFQPESETLLDHLLRDGPARDAWQHWGSEIHGIHPEAAMLDALESHFTVETRLAVPYAYRYFLTGLSPDRSGVETALELLAEELRAIEAGQFRALGRRWIASRD